MRRTGTLFLKALFILCIVFIIGVTLGINSKKSTDTVYEDTLKKEKQETVVKAKPTTVEELINKETKQLLDTAIMNPEAQIDFMDFMSAISDEDKIILIKSLEEDYANDALANILIPVFLYYILSFVGKQII